MEVFIINKEWSLWSYKLDASGYISVWKYKSNYYKQGLEEK